jgi:hypothetical protein
MTSFDLIHCYYYLRTRYIAIIYVCWMQFIENGLLDDTCPF